MSKLLQQSAGVAGGRWLGSCLFWQLTLCEKPPVIREWGMARSTRPCVLGRDNKRDIDECQTLLDVSHKPLGYKVPQQGVCHAEISSKHALNLAGVESVPVSTSCSQGHACAHALYDLLPMTVRLCSLGI